MENREDEGMTKVSSTSTEVTTQARKKGATPTTERRSRAMASSEKDELYVERQLREAETTRRRLEERAARIDELRARVSGGTYKVDSMTVAQRIQDSPVMPIIMGKNTAGLHRLPRLPRSRRLL